MPQYLSYTEELQGGVNQPKLDNVQQRQREVDFSLESARAAQSISRDADAGTCSMCDVRVCSQLLHHSHLASFPPVNRPHVRASWWRALHDRLNFRLTVEAVQRVRVCERHFAAGECVPRLCLGERSGSPPPVPRTLLSRSPCTTGVTSETRTYSRRDRQRGATCSSRISAGGLPVCRDTSAAGSTQTQTYPSSSTCDQVKQELDEASAIAPFAPVRCDSVDTSSLSPSTHISMLDTKRASCHTNQLAPVAAGCDVTANTGTAMHDCHGLQVIAHDEHNPGHHPTSLHHPQSQKSLHSRAIVSADSNGSSACIASERVVVDGGQNDQMRWHGVQLADCKLDVTVGHLSGSGSGSVLVPHGASCRPDVTDHVGPYSSHNQEIAAVVTSQVHVARVPTPPHINLLSYQHRPLSEAELLLLEQ